MTSDRIKNGNCFSEADYKDKEKTNYIGIMPSMIDSCIDQLKEKLKEFDQVMPQRMMYR